MYDHLYLPIISILVGIFCMGFSIRHILIVFIEMIWLLTRVCNRPEIDKGEKVSFNFSTMFMALTCASGPAGLAFLLLGIKYLPT